MNDEQKAVEELRQRIAVSSVQRPMLAIKIVLDALEQAQRERDEAEVNLSIWVKKATKLGEERDELQTALHQAGKAHESLADKYQNARRSVLEETIAYLRHFFGHEIIRSVTNHLAQVNGLPHPEDPFHYERLHPGVTLREVPQTLEEMLKGQDAESQAKAAAQASPSSPASPQSGDCLQQAQAAAPAASAPKGPEPLNAGRGLASLDLDLMRLQVQVETLEGKLKQELAKLLFDVCERFEAGEKRLGTLEKHLDLGAVPPHLARLPYLEARVDAQKLKHESLTDHLWQLQQAQAELPKPPPPAPPDAPPASGSSPIKVVGLVEGSQLGEVRDLRVQWDGLHWLLMRLSVH